METLFVFLVLVVAVGAALIWYSHWSWQQMTPEQREAELERRRPQKERLADCGIAADALFESKESCLAMDSRQQKLAILEEVSSGDWLVLDFAAVRGAELKIDGETITRTSSSRSLVGALAGGAIFGPAGAIVGGLGARTRSSAKQEVRQIDLWIFIDDLARPVRTVRFMRYSLAPGARFEADAAEQAAVEWLARIETIVERQQHAVLPGVGS